MTQIKANSKMHKVMLASYNQSVTFDIALTNAEAQLLYDIQKATESASMCLVLDPGEDYDPYD